MCICAMMAWADPRAQAAADTDAVAILRSARNASESCKTRAVF
jgi:hypothetical protein